MSDIKIYQNKGGDIRWDGKQSARYDSKCEPGGCVKRAELLREDDPRYPHVADARTIALVDKMPTGDDIKELQHFIDRGNFKPEWIAGWMERLVAKEARVEFERKAEEEARHDAADREEERSWRQTVLDAANKGGSPPRTAKASKGGWDEKATALFLKNPTFSKKQLAEQLGANEKSLAPSRCPMLTRAIAASKAAAGNRPRGMKDKDGNLEAWDE